MRSVALMQPYFFPYIGYFQLIHAVERFVIYDDVQYMKGGWVNRNRILLSGQPCYITLPVSKGHISDDINQRCFSEEFEKGKQRILGQLKTAYRKAPNFSKVMQLIEDVFACNNTNIAGFLIFQLRTVCEYLGIKTTILVSSELENRNTALTGKDRVIDICKSLGAEQYVNAIGGTELYDQEGFSRENMQLNFIKMGDFTYKQYEFDFVANLSIIDVMMFNSSEETTKLLNNYKLI